MDAISEFNSWFRVPIQLGLDSEPSVEQVLVAIDGHPLSSDEWAQDYVMPPSRFREHARRFRVCGECQDTWFCFVKAGDECKPDPPVYFESCLDLVEDYGLDPAEIVDETVVVADGFRAFLWHMLASQICLRHEKSSHLCDSVSGIQFEEVLELDGHFSYPLRRPFPAGFTSFVSPGAIYIPGWGAAFRSEREREDFVRIYHPDVRASWA